MSGSIRFWIFDNGSRSGMTMIEKQKTCPSMCEAIESALMTLVERGHRPVFLFVGNSVLHITALNAFLLLLQNEGVTACGVVCNNIPSERIPQYDERDVFAVDADKFVLLRNDIDYHKIKQSMSTRVKNSLFPAIPKQACNKGDGVPYKDSFFLIATDEDYPPLELWKAASTQGLQVKCILVEEGIGSYLPRESAHRLFALKEANFVKRAKRLAKERISVLFRACYRSVLDTHCSIERFSAYDRLPEGELIANAKFIYWMKQALQQYSSIKEIHNSDFSGKVVIVGTNFQELGEECLERAFLERITRAIKACGLKPYLRPHPRTRKIEHYIEMGIEVDKYGKVPFEAVLSASRAKPVAIVGLGSSSQMLANMFWGISCLNVAPILLDEANSRGSTTRLIRVFGIRAVQFSKALPGCMELVNNDEMLQSSLRLAARRSSDHWPPEPLGELESIIYPSGGK